MAATASFVDPQNGDLATAEHVAQLVEDFQGLRNIPISLSGINDAATYALTLKNAGTGSRDLIAYAADGTTVLLQVDATGVTLGSPVNLPPGSISGSAIAAGSITNAMLGADVARDNLLVNGSMAVAQRGGGPFSANGAWTADRWQILLGTGSTISVTAGAAAGAIAAIGPGGANVNCLSGSFTWAADTYIAQQLKFAGDGGQPGLLRGRPVTLSMRVYTATPNAIRLALVTDGTGAGITFSSYCPGDSQPHTLFVTNNVPLDATVLNIYVYLSASVPAWYVGQAMLVVGSQAANYVPMHPADDLARCLRYYEVVAEDLNLTGYGGAVAAPLQWYLNFKARKAVTATLTKVGTWGVVNCAQPAIVAVASISGLGLGTTATAIGTLQLSAAASNYLTAESNP